MKRLISLLLCLATVCSCFAFVGCGEKKRDANTLEVRYFAGGFGSEWLVSAKQKFEAAHAGITVNLVNEEDLRTNASVYLRSGRNLPDIMMSQTLGWASFVSQGYLEPLDDVFESEAKPGVKLKDFLADEYSEYPYMQRLYGQGEKHAWVIPWSALNCGIVYNETMLLETPRRAASGNWTAPPATVDELKEYVEDVKAAHSGVVPFAWGGGALNWLLFPMYTWWAQIQGVETSNQPGEGSWYDFWDFDAPGYANADVYKQTGIWKALDIVRDLLVDTQAKDWKNSPDKVSGLAQTDAERRFIEGKAAMIFCGSWLENEMRDFIPSDFKMKMMPTPIAEGAQINPATGKPYVINNTNAGDVMFIPAAAPNKELAKEFLKFISTEKMMLDFSRHTKMIRPYKYDPVALDPEFAWSGFARSCFDLYNDSDYNLYEYSKNGSVIFTYKRPELFQEVTMATAMNGLKRMTGKEIMIDGNTTEKYTSVFDLVSIEYPKWKEEIGI